ncbi:MAG: transcriptional activator NhaR [Nitrospirae bacterium]|nr:MAG: transcriptional activator NhaR [Nitrospirota bacterium]
MQWLNFNHLFYFWMVAREGSILRACQRLHLAQPTVSTQIKALEQSLNEKLFQREGRRLVLTEAGQIVYRYAEDMFELSQEFQSILKGQPTGRPLRLKVGIADVLPKRIAYLLLEPLMELPYPIRLVCYESEPRRLLSDLAAHSLDVVMTDAPPLPTFKSHAHCHLLGQSSVTLLATPALARQYKKKFPASLQDAPFLLPTLNTFLRRAIEDWFDEKNLEPTVVGEFEDSALLMSFGQDGRGIIPVHTIIEKDIRRQYNLEAVGVMDSVQTSFYAISVERKLRNPALTTMYAAAEQRLFNSRKT